MNAREWNRTMDEREQKVAMCSKTYFNLTGEIPGVRELTEWLGDGYRLDILRFCREMTPGNLVCA